MKRLMTLLLTLVLLFSLAAPMPALADGEGWYMVQSTSPNGYCYLYSKPSSQDGVSRNLGRYDNGELVYVLDYNGGGEGKHLYCLVQTQDEKTGYINAASLTRYYGTVATPSAGWYMVQSAEPNGYCYLYSHPSSRDEISRNLGRYDNGEWVYVLDYYGGSDGGDPFSRVQTQDGKTGYIRASSLTRSSGSSGSKPTAKPGSSQSGKLANLPELTYQCRGTVTGGNINVYTGPASSYYRTASGKAYVANGASLRIWGREGDYYLIEYAALSGSKTVTRFSFIPVNRLSARGSVERLEYGWAPIRIASGAHMADAPDQSHSYNTIEIDRKNAFALAKYVDEDGVTWVYFESIGYANTASNQGYVSVRGFVPVSEVELR